MYLAILIKSAESYFFNIFPQGSHRNCAIWKCSTRLILVNFCFLKSSQNSLQHSANLVFVAICGGFSPFWPQIDWTTCGGTISGEYNLYVLHTFAWWGHQMETFAALLAICAGNSQITGEFPAHRPVTRSFGVFFDLRLNKPLSKQWWGWWFETLSRPLWRHCNTFSIIIWNWNDTGSWNPSTWKTNN